LQSTLGVSIENTGWAASVPYIAAALGAIFAGRVTLVLARKYAMISMTSKKTILVGGCVGLGILLCLVPFVHNLALALAVLSLALALVAAVQAQSWAISSDIVPDSHAARFGGIMNFGGYFGGALAPIVTGAVVDATGSYTPSLLVAGLIAVLGGLCYGLMVRKPIHAIAWSRTEASLPAPGPVLLPLCPGGPRPDLSYAIGRAGPWPGRCRRLPGVPGRNRLGKLRVVPLAPR